MIPFRKNLAITVDGGGIRGLIVTQALTVLERYLGTPLHERARLVVGTSTGAIIAAGIAAGFSAQEMTQRYLALGKSIFPNTLRKWLFPLTRTRYPDEPLNEALRLHFGDLKMADFWTGDPPTDLVITTFDLVENRTRFIKSWKDEYADWPVVKAVQASCAVPTYFPIVENRLIDGGVGSYANPCYVAAYEAKECLGWDLADTTLVSIGTGRSPYSYDPTTAPRLWPLHWIGRILGVFSQSAHDQQVHLVQTYFKGLDFRRFQIDLRENIEMDDTRQMDRLVAYGARLGRMILSDRYDRAQGVIIKRVDLIS
ncbi:MAG: patatin-like phospholipase family protein [Brevefilum sp.]|nr:patatin-like phospholipase family protein [Brevefilum sp.]